jgi:hypothetical protein
MRASLAMLGSLIVMSQGNHRLVYVVLAACHQRHALHACERRVLQESVL